MNRLAINTGGHELQFEVESQTIHEALEEIHYKETRRARNELNVAIWFYLYDKNGIFKESDWKVYDDKPFKHYETCA